MPGALQSRGVHSVRYCALVFSWERKILGNSLLSWFSSHRKSWRLVRLPMLSGSSATGHSPRDERRQILPTGFGRSEEGSRKLTGQLVVPNSQFGEARQHSDRFRERCVVELFSRQLYRVPCAVGGSPPVKLLRSRINMTTRPPSTMTPCHVLASVFQPCFFAHACPPHWL